MPLATLKEILAKAKHGMCEQLPENQIDPKKYMLPVKDSVPKPMREKLAAFGSENKG